MKHYCITLVALLGAIAVISANFHTSVNYSISDTINAGGTQTAGDNYANQGSIGEIGGTGSITAVGASAKHGFIGQLHAVDITVMLSESADPILAGSSLTYIITATNTGPDDATGVTVSQALNLPPGVSVDSVTTSAGASYASPTWTIGQLGNDASATLTVVLNVAPTAISGIDVIGDTAAVIAVSGSDSNHANDSVMETTSIDGKRYYDWRSEHFLAADLAVALKEASVWGAQANPDRDFRPNIFEFFHGSDPNMFDPDPAVSLGLQGQKTTFSFKQRDDLGGITFQFQTSGDPKTGFTEILTPNASEPAGGAAGFSDVVFKDTDDVSAGSPRFGQIVLDEE
ncbi:MAG: putative repeat protein (TIGR01451 family) [Verrucomicrobiales bacterium]|jgi:uncharacterized repeat protein (TIGR01451 family)